MWEEPGASTRTLSEVALRCVLQSLMSFSSSERKTEREKVMFLINCFHKRYTVCTLYTLVCWKNYILTFFLTSICWLCIFLVALWMVKMDGSCWEGRIKYILSWSRLFSCIDAMCITNLRRACLHQYPLQPWLKWCLGSAALHIKKETHKTNSFICTE